MDTTIEVNNIADDVLIAIFSYLNLQQRIAVQRVCKQWQRLSLVGVQRLVFVSKQRSETLFSYEFRNRNVTLRIDDAKQINNVVSKCSALKSVSFYGCYFPDGDRAILDEIGDAMRTVKALNLYECNDIDDYGFVSLIKNAASLEEISITGCDDISNSALNVLFKRCHNLNELILHHAFELSLVSMKCLPRNLKVFKYYNNTSSDVLEETLSCVLKTSSQTLETLCVSDVESIDCFKVISSFENLTDLRFRLYFPYFVEYWWTFLKCSNLRVLEISACDAYLRDANLIKVVCRNQNLQILVLKWNTFMEDNCLQVTDVFIDTLSVSCFDLKILIIEEAADLTDECLKYLLRLSRLEQVQVLNCIHITDEAMATFVGDAPSLRVLKFNDDTTEKTGTAMVSKATSNPSLTFWAHLSSEMEISVNNLQLFTEHTYDQQTWDHFFNINCCNKNCDYFAWKKYRLP